MGSGIKAQQVMEQCLIFFPPSRKDAENTVLHSPSLCFLTPDMSDVHMEQQEREVGFVNKWRR